MYDSLYDFLMRHRMCTNCGLVDHDGEWDWTRYGLAYYCRKHLDQREDARMLSKDRVTTSYL